MQGVDRRSVVGKPTANRGQISPEAGFLRHVDGQLGQAIGPGLPVTNCRRLHDLGEPIAVRRSLGARFQRRLVAQQNGHIDGLAELGQQFHRPRILLGSARLQLQQRAGGSWQTMPQEPARRHPHRLIRASGERSRGMLNCLLHEAECRSWIAVSHQYGLFGQGDLILWEFFGKRRGRNLSGLALVGSPQQQALKREQTLPVAPRLLLHETLDVLQSRQVLLPFEHPVDLLKLGERVVAAKLDLLARAAGAKRIGVE